jgi:hypothetical protein
VNTTRIALPDHRLKIGNIAWLYPTAYGDIPVGMYRVIQVDSEGFSVRRSWCSDMWNRLMYA